tara:strand:- start:664 stop:951 length:288 start_codon:yes stop_codon:yes gene_type:complete
MPNYLNVIIENEHLWRYDEDLLFGSLRYRHAAEFNVLRVKPEEADMYDLLVQVGAYPTRILAEASWKETGAQIPEGYSDFFTVNGKRLVIWNPTV